MNIKTGRTKPKASVWLPLVAAGALSAASINAHALTTAYTGAGGAGMVYSSLGNITWTADGNLFQTMASSYAGGATAFANAVIAAVPGGKINHTPNPVYDTPPNSGYYNLSSSDFNTNKGVVSWFGAQAFTTYLNSISYGGSNQWRLPTVTDTSTPGCNFAYSGTDCGYNVNTATGEMAKLYYDELSATPYYNTSGVGPQVGYNILGTGTTADTTGSVGPFSNVHTLAYWSGTEYAPIPTAAWYFRTNFGFQDGTTKGSQVYAWAVSPGYVDAVPVPAAAWLFGPALLVLLGFKRRGHAG